MMRLISKAAALLLAVMLLTGLACSAQADFAYEAVEATIPVGGTGTFKLASAEEPDTALDEITIEGSGAFSQSFDEPGDYEFVIYSEDAVNTARYDVLVRVLTDAEDVLEAHVVVAESDTGRKVPSALYPVKVDPPIAKRLTGETPPSTETFEFRFRAVSTTAEGLEGNLPMPEGSNGQEKKITIVGAGETEAGEYYLEKAGVYVYEFVEVNTGKAGYTYDTSVYRVTFTVTETEEGFHVDQVMTKNGVETERFLAVFTNSYRTKTYPKTGDENSPVLWMAVLVGSFTCLAAASYRLKKIRD